MQKQCIKTAVAKEKLRKNFKSNSTDRNHSAGYMLGPEEDLKITFQCQNKKQKDGIMSMTREIDPTSSPVFCRGQLNWTVLC